MSRERYDFLVQATLLLLDAAMIAIAVCVAFILRRTIPVPEVMVDAPQFATMLRFIPLQIIGVIGLMYLNRMYHQVRASSARVDEISVVLLAATGGTLVAVALNTLTYQNTQFEANLPRALLIYAWLCTVIFVAIGRLLHQNARQRLLKRGVGRERVIVVGTNDVSQVVVQKIQWSPKLGYDLVGLIANQDEHPPEMLGTPVIGQAADIISLLETHAIDEVIIALPQATRLELLNLIADCHRGQVSVRVLPDVFEIMAGEVSVADLGGLPLLNVRDIALRGWRLSLKRGFDIAGSAFGLFLTAPIMVLLGILIKLESPGPALFIQERVGLDGKPFKVLKFRSMRADAESLSTWTVKDDPRRTRIGTFIRKYSLDELPQFVNVLLGEMSLVGPRPEQERYVEEFRQSIPRYMERHREKAGLTGWAQVNGLRGDSSIEERTKYDLWYIEHWSLWLDIKICVRTAIQAFTGQAY